jgi:hypothetical protein
MTRERLPNRRASETFNLECNGLRYTATISRFADGRLAEIFLTNHKAGSQADANARDSAVVCSHVRTRVRALAALARGKPDDFTAVEFPDDDQLLGAHGGYSSPPCACASLLVVRTKLRTGAHET